MGIISAIAGAFGFGIGITLGLVIGYFLFIFIQSSDVEVSYIIKNLVPLSSESIKILMFNTTLIRLCFLLKNPEIKPLVEQDEPTLQRMFPEIPIWVKNPDHDRVTCCFFIIWFFISRLFCMILIMIHCLSIG